MEEINCSLPLDAYIEHLIVCSKASRIVEARSVNTSQPGALFVKVIACRQCNTARYQDRRRSGILWSYANVSVGDYMHVWNVGGPLINHIKLVI